MTTSIEFVRLIGVLAMALLVLMAGATWGLSRHFKQELAAGKIKLAEREARKNEHPASELALNAVADLLSRQITTLKETITKQNVASPAEETEETVVPSPAEGVHVLSGKMEMDVPSPAEYVALPSGEVVVVRRVSGKPTLSRNPMDIFITTAAKQGQSEIEPVREKGRDAKSES